MSRSLDEDEFLKPPLTLLWKKILQLVTQRSLFWKPEDFTSATQKECSVFTMRVKKLLRGYYILAFTTLILYDLQPIVGGIVPTACYVPPFSFKYLVVLAWYLSVVACLVICGIDSFFVSLATSLWLQFKLLHYKIKENDICTEESDKQSWKKVKEFVDHHVFLLSYCQKLNIAFQPMFMLQFLLPVANGALGIFISLQPGLWSNRMKSFVYFVRTLGEAAFYCVPAEFLISSANKVCDVVYESNWYELNKEQIKKCFSLVMMKSQKLLVFSAYGLVWINLGTLVVGPIPADNRD
ncbi:uncharacterized protein LOC135126779 [Zophobas morio]|uniref:uncharacterized protein LOC135126779 n=1 Tax=Zophobas morio TaxID=2755281 RepID=UPI003083ABCF